MKNLYTILMILLPIFVGSLATGEVIRYFSGQEINMNIFVCSATAIVGMGTGISNIMKLLK